jgi:hypothetical protein
VTVRETATLTDTKTVTETLVYPASLHATADVRGMLIGSSVSETDLEDERFGPTLVREFNYLNPGGLG